jgi:hypothetical protein
MVAADALIPAAPAFCGSEQMTDQPGRPSRLRHIFAVALVAGGVLIIAGLGFFIWVAIGFRRSFTSSLPPLEDMAQGLALLSPFILLALLLIGYGRRLLRKE